MSDGHKIASELLNWISSRDDSRYTLRQTAEDDTDLIFLETANAKAEVVVHYLEYTICELRVTDSKGENVFYLHFELNDLEHAKGLFNEMLECLLKQKEDNTIHVLLCCTCGLTTSYFTMNLNDTVKMLNLKMDFEAVPYDRLYETAKAKDVILIAPQIGYQLRKVQSILTDKTVMAIPASIFSSYDVLGMINMIRDEYTQKEKEEAAEGADIRSLANSDGSILIVSVIDMEGRTQLAYRLYDSQSVIMENQIVKSSYKADDIIDVIGSVTKLNQGIRMIGLISPGSFVQGKLTYEKENIFDFDITKEIEERFGCRTIVLNDADAIALGYSRKELKGKQAAFYFLPTGDFAGNIGIAEGGKIFGSAGHMGGIQLGPVTDITTFPKNPYALAKTPEGNVQLAARYITGLITYTGCRHIAFYAKMIPDVNDLIKEISEFIPPAYMPEIVKVASVRDYLYDGALHYMNNRKDQ